MASAGSQHSEKTRVIRPDFSLMQLPEIEDLRRLPRAPHRTRDEKFMCRFEDRIIFYDCFWHEAGDRIMLVGPPPFNLEPHHADAKFIAQPSGTPLAATCHMSRSTMLTVLDNAPPSTNEITVHFAGKSHVLPVQHNLAPDLSGANLLFTMSKDNALPWIESWARWHSVMHEIDTIILFDNGSTTTSLADIERTLTSLPGLKNLILIDWPHRYGATDKAVLMHRFWAQFLQVSAMNLVLRRFGAQANAIVNCDVDELVAPLSHGTLADTLQGADNGLIHLDGTWVESVSDAARTPAGARTHFDYLHVNRGFTRHLSPPKWVLDPQRDWVRDLTTFPYMHDVKFPPKDTKPVEGKFWHFKGINNNWKSARHRLHAPNSLWHREEAQLKAARATYLTAIGPE